MGASRQPCNVLGTLSANVPSTSKMTTSLSMGSYSPVGTHWGHESSYGVKEILDSRLKTALDESRLLILGAQVLFGFQFQAVFQERFNEISSDSKLIHGVGLLLLLVTVGALIAPSMQHQITYRGESRRGALKAATALAGASVLPLWLASASPRSLFSIICWAAHRG
jgi:hypothetical protein